MSIAHGYLGGWLIIGIMLSRRGRFIDMMPRLLDREVKVRQQNCNRSISKYDSYILIKSNSSQ